MNISKKTLKKLYLLFASVMAILMILFFWSFKGKTKQIKISEFGSYRGYSVSVYDGAKRVSAFLTMADGTKLAYDLFIPTKKGVPIDKPLPVLFKYTPYGRAWTVYNKNGQNNLAELGVMPWYYRPLLKLRCWFKGNVMDALSRTEWLERIVKFGYAAIVVDRPGTGASFGRLNMNPEACMSEVGEILDWIASQNWCDGNIGMFGDSIQAQIQFQAAATGNPHLKAILPATTWMDNYSAVMYPGGVRNKALANLYIKLNKVFDSLATPVDSDKNGAFLAQAQAERHLSVALAQQVGNISSDAFRDVTTANGKNLWEDYQTLYPLLDRINKSGVPVYLIGGWYDIYARDDFLIYANLTVPKRLLFRPKDHSDIEASGPDVDYAAEVQRWFDYWLKGIDNGIMKEPPIHYYLQGEEKRETWKASDVWPLKDLKMTQYYFGPEKNDGKASINDGTLNLKSPTVISEADYYTPDYTTTIGKKSQWTSLATGHQYPNMRTNDAKALTYTTPILKEAVPIVGHPIAHIWLSVSTPDLDIFAYLEEVDKNGNSKYITQGNLRASHRTLGKAPFENFSLPWHNYYKSELKSIPSGEPVELVFDLLPTAYRISKGNRIRITITCADADNFETLKNNPAPKIQLLRDIRHPSFVALPVVQIK